MFGGDQISTQSGYEPAILQNVLPVNYYSRFVDQKVPVY